jgi:GNAT superfamily N-acetyltransferase
MHASEAGSLASLSIRPVGLAEMPLIAELYAKVRFRPDLVDDLKVVLALDGAVFAAFLGDVLIGSSSCVEFGGTGWVGGVAVDPDCGRRGYGRRLTETAIDSLRERGVQTTLLHATAMARQLYARMGFEVAGEYVELHGPGRSDWSVDPFVRPAQEDDLKAVLELDRSATGEDRSRLLSMFWPGDILVYARGAVRGFAIRQYPTAIGAIAAVDEEAGQALFISSQSERPVALRVSVPAHHLATRNFLEGLGYKESLQVTRMHVGGSLPHCHEDRVFSVFNLYWG